MTRRLRTCGIVGRVLRTVMQRLGLVLFVLATVVAVIGMHSLGAGHTPAGHSSGHGAGHGSVPQAVQPPADDAASAAETAGVSTPVGEGDHGLAQMCLAILSLALGLVLAVRRALRRSVALAFAAMSRPVPTPARPPPLHLRPSLDRLCVSRT